MVIEEPKLTIKSLVKDNFNVNNTSDATVTPQIHTGWYDSNNTNPQITVTNADETAIGGGITGFSGLTGSGSVVQLWDGFVQIDFWVTRDDVSCNPKLYLFEMRREVARIIRTNPDHGIALNHIGWLGGNEAVETDVSPAIFRFIGGAGYSYLDK